MEIFFGIKLLLFYRQSSLFTFCMLWVENGFSFTSLSCWIYRYFEEKSKIPVRLMLKCVNEIPMDKPFYFFFVAMKFIHCFAHFVLCRLEKRKKDKFIMLFFFTRSLCPFKQNGFNAIDTEYDFPVIDFNIIFMSLQNRIIII